MLLQLSHFFSPLSPSTLQFPSQHHPPLSSCPWVVHISSLASPFPVLFFKKNFIDYAITVVPLSFLYSTPHCIPPHTLTLSPFSSCPWVVHISSLASPFPILFLPSPVYFIPTICASYSL